MKKNLTKIFFSLAVPSLLVGCHRSGGGASHGTAKMPPPLVTVVPLVAQEITEWDEFTGRTAAIENVEVRPRISGHIQAVKFQSGQLVKKGDVLFQIDPRWQQADYARR